jgi:hypothetical protein
MAGSESQSLPPQLTLLGPTSATVPAKQLPPPRGTSAGNRAAAATDARSRQSPPSESWDVEDGVHGDACGEAAVRFFLPLGGMGTARGGPSNRAR